jgi:hypothetical protein
MSVTTFCGFSSTYFGPILGGQYPAVSPTVHLHGWVFFAWYLLLPLQAGVIAVRRVALLRLLGAASVALAVVMVVTGFVVIGTRVSLSLAPDGDPFWYSMGPGIFATLVLFAAFYVAAFRTRRCAASHRRFVVLASAGGLGAAAFRVFGALFGFAPWVPIAGILAPNVFLVAAMVHDVRREGRVHPIYRYGLLVSMAIEGVLIAAGLTSAGDPVRAALAWVGRIAAPLY